MNKMISVTYGLMLAVMIGMAYVAASGITLAGPGIIIAVSLIILLTAIVIDIVKGHNGCGEHRFTEA